ncbi:MAG TPA: hypothetical protein VFG66_17395 [Gemmatimonadales bacterium]|nr:hypothetical protein [Gemmatimonadales bacterium]
MAPPARSLVLVTLLASLVLPGGAAAAQPVAGDTAALEFHGFRAGAHLAELQAMVRGIDGGLLRCDRAKADHRVSECRGTLDDPALGGPVSLWISAIDSVASVITISASVAPAQLDRWREAVEHRYGRVDASVQGSQWMMQWVRRGRMLRLTWRVERGERVASVSLVDGRVLDSWGRGPG